MDVREFDRFADEYLATHAENIRLSGEEPEYFARYKIDEVRRLWTAQGLAEPKAILDFGSGIGNSWPFLAKAFPGAKIIGLDVSSRSLAVAQSRFPALAEALVYDGTGAIRLPDANFDLIFSSCVFHHIDAAEHAALFRELRRLLAPGGRLVVFEHNPANPVTRHIVATCVFDENATLVAPGALKRSQFEAGFAAVKIAYTAFFPGALAALRPLERFMAALPIGAQYYTLAHA